jgi:hypothetical protein
MERIASIPLWDLFTYDLGKGLLLGALNESCGVVIRQIEAINGREI